MAQHFGARQVSDLPEVQTLDGSLPCNAVEDLETANGCSASLSLAAHQIAKPAVTRESGTLKRLPGIAAREPSGVLIDSIKNATVEPAWCRRSSSIPAARSSQQASTRFRRPGS